MRTLLVADVHGNLAALEAVLAVPHDALICLGDLVGCGPEPGECVRRIRAEAVVTVQGNHDHLIAAREAPAGPEPFRTLARATAPIAYRELGPEELAYLGGLPQQAWLQLGVYRCFCVHATPADPLYRAVGPDPAAWARELVGLNAGLVLVGHTHRQFDLRTGGRRVVNPGSVGLPLDGDARAAYALLEHGRVTLGRVPYPVERTIEALRRATLPPTVVDGLAAWLREGRAPPWPLAA